LPESGHVQRLLPLIILLTATPAQGADEEAAGKDEKDDAPAAYSDVVTEKAETDEGLFAIHRIDEQFLFEIPHELLGRDMLLVSRIARVPANLGGGRIAAGHKTGEQVVRWERLRNRILLRKVSYRNFADEELPIYRSVVNNNFFPILATFDVEVEGPADEKADRTTVVIDVSDFYRSDIPAISGLAAHLREDYEVGKLDDDRSFINYAHSYPENVDVRHTLTFEAKEPPADEDARTISLEMHQSMVLLPEEPMRPRYADSRIGWFTVERTNFGLDEQKATDEKLLQRWRLEPKDPKAYAKGRLVEPLRPIVWYIDPATPEKWVPWVKKGVEDWRAAFESAGFKNAVQAKDAPKDEPDWNGEDVRYSMVRWAANTYRNAMGPSVADPRSGEIIEADIVWYHNHMRSYRNRLMIETGAANPLARSLPIDDDLMGEAIRQVIAHEIGHALGLPHNMIASASYPVEKLRDPVFCREMGVAPSIMDYARQNYVAQPGDGLEGADFIRKIGPYDHYAIGWGYRVIPDAKSPEDEKPVLDAWILEKAGDPMYRYGPQRGGPPIDPRIQTEDLADDAVAATRYAIANLKRVVPRLVEWTATPGEDWSDLREIYDGVFWNYGRYCGHVVSVIGGVYQDLKAADQDGRVHRPVPAAKQREAMAFLAEHALSTPRWLLDPEILRRIEHGGDVERVRDVQSRVLAQLLDPGRMQRLVETGAQEGADAYSLAEFLDDVKTAVWGDLAASEQPDPYRRTLQRAHLERLEWLMAEEPPEPEGDWEQFTPVHPAASDARALVRAQLRDLEARTRDLAASAADAMSRAHYADASERIAAFLEGKKL